jgi:multidrug efflux pump subunit AcrB
VVYVTADMAGDEESPVYGMARVDKALDELAARGEGAWQSGDTSPLTRLYTAGPDTTHDIAMKWDGEWQITYEVFRDMGVAFGVVLVLIAILVVGWFGSYTTPLAIMIPIPLSLIGIIPPTPFPRLLHGHVHDRLHRRAGIVVRNSIILVDFIVMRREQGETLETPCRGRGRALQAMVLTALSVVAVPSSSSSTPSSRAWPSRSWPGSGRDALLAHGRAGDVLSGSAQGA